MFKFLKEKLGKALEKIRHKVDEEIPTEETEIIGEAVKEPKKKNKKAADKSKEEKDIKNSEQQKTEEKEPPKKGIFSKIFKKEKEVKQVGIEEIDEVESKGLFGKIKETITTKKISAEKFDELFSELEVALLENNVALEVVDKIKQKLKDDLVDVPINRKEIATKINKSLKESLNELFSIKKIDIIEEIKKKDEKPYVICFVGVNGSGKTTTVAKIAHYLKRNKISVLLVAGDTWRAASIQQLEEHGRKLGVKVVKHNYGSDPAAVAFDGIKSAKANKIDAVLIDTAGRQHSNKDLMREVEKIARVARPDLKIFVGESIAGNDCILQAQQFEETLNIDGIILTKSDVDEKGGAAISVSYVAGKPILFLGRGQSYDDLEEFDSKKLIESLGI